MKIILAAAIFVSASAFAQDRPGRIMAGPSPMRFSCIDLKVFATENPDTSDSPLGIKQSDWTDSMASFVRMAAFQCSSQLRNDLASQGRLSDTAEVSIRQEEKAVVRRATEIESQNTTSREARHIEDQREKDRKVEAVYPIKQDPEVRVHDCKATKRHQLFTAQEAVTAYVEQLDAWRQNQRQEAKIARVSGVRNLLAERTNGEWIVQLTDDLKESFAEYRSLGGKAPTPQKVNHQVKDPCDPG